MPLKDILTENRFFRTPVFQNTSKTHNNMKIGKEVKTIIVVNTSLHSLTWEFKAMTCKNEKGHLANNLWTFLRRTIFAWARDSRTTWWPCSECCLALCVSACTSSRHPASLKKKYDIWIWFYRNWLIYYFETTAMTPSLMSCYYWAKMKREVWR